MVLSRRQPGAAAVLLEDRWVRGTVARRSRAAGHSHVVRYHRLLGWALLWLICFPMPLRTARRGVWRCSALSRYQCTPFPADRHGLQVSRAGKEREPLRTLRLASDSVPARAAVGALQKAPGFAGPRAAIANNLLRFHSGALTGPRPIFARLALTRLAVRPPAGEPAAFGSHGEPMCPAKFDHNNEHS